MAVTPPSSRFVCKTIYLLKSSGLELLQLTSKDITFFAQMNFQNLGFKGFEDVNLRMSHSLTSSPLYPHVKYLLSCIIYRTRGKRIHPSRVMMLPDLLSGSHNFITVIYLGWFRLCLRFSIFLSLHFLKS